MVTDPVVREQALPARRGPAPGVRPRPGAALDPPGLARAADARRHVSGCSTGRPSAARDRPHPAPRGVAGTLGDSAPL